METVNGAWQEWVTVFGYLGLTLVIVGFVMFAPKSK